MARPTTKPDKEERPEVEITDVHVDNVKMWNNNNITFDLAINGVTIYGCRDQETKEGRSFIAFPSHQGKNGKWYSYAYVKLSEEMTKDILENMVYPKCK